MHFYAASYALLWRTALRSSAGQGASRAEAGINRPAPKSCKARPARALPRTCPCPASLCAEPAYSSP